jgi:hypothetical protein
MARTTTKKEQEPFNYKLIQNPKNMKKLFFLIAFTVTITSSVFLSQSTFGQKDSCNLPPLKEGMARIIFTRLPSMMGAAVIHLVVDNGDTANFNARTLQNKTFPVEKGNFDVGINVKLMYVKLNDKDSKVIIGKAPQGDIKINGPFIIDSFPELVAIPGPFKTLAKGSTPYYFINSTGINMNTRLVGAVTSGSTICWDRPAGVMRLQDITSGGDQAFALPVTVEAGKTYIVSYTYMKALFEVKEK